MSFNYVIYGNTIFQSDTSFTTSWDPVPPNCDADITDFCYLQSPPDSSTLCNSESVFGSSCLSLYDLNTGTYINPPPPEPPPPPGDTSTGSNNALTQMLSTSLGDPSNQTPLSFSGLLVPTIIGIAVILATIYIALRFTKRILSLIRS